MREENAVLVELCVIRTNNKKTHTLTHTGGLQNFRGGNGGGICYNFREGGEGG